MIVVGVMFMAVVSPLACNTQGCYNMDKGSELFRKTYQNLIIPNENLGSQGRISHSNIV